MRLEEETRHNTKIAAPTAEGPEQIRVLALASIDKTAVGQDDVRFEKVVDGEAVLARWIASTSAEGEASDTGGRDDAKGYGTASLYSAANRVWSF